jgi:pimeloyl-ACP methyl ester carboxylesterase
VIGPLADPVAHGGDPAAWFDVVVPSLPGFGFSGPTAVPGWNFWHAADTQVGLMRAIGYERFAAAGGDIGSLIVAHLGHAHADAVIGVYTHQAVPMTVFQTVPTGEGPLDAVAGIEYARVLPAASAYRPGEEDWSERNFGPADTGYSAIQITKPQSLAVAMNDSPAGLAAWMLEKRHVWADVHGGLERVFSKDDMCDIASIGWFTGTYASSLGSTPTRCAIRGVLGTSDCLGWRCRRPSRSSPRTSAGLRVSGWNATTTCVSGGSTNAAAISHPSSDQTHSSPMCVTSSGH